MIFTKAGSADSSSTRGFTLLEVLIAITIFAVSVSIVYALYGAVLTSVNQAEARSAQNSRLQITFERFNTDLAGLYQGKQGFLVGRTADNSAEEAILEFVSTSHLSFDPEAPAVPLAVIRYYLGQSAGAETFSLSRSDSPVIFGAEDGAVAENRKLVVCEGLTEIKLSYLDREGQEFSEWETVSESEEEQEDPNRFPALVTVELVFAGDGQSSTNSYSSAIRLRPALLDYGGDSDVR